jgi:spore coat polysaccharide biosynthesis protein SpsF (cytidylyltransferase family)
MKIIQSKKMRQQPLIWKKAALNETPNGWTWKDIVFYPIHSWLYKLNNNPSLLVDELIMGSNPLINLLLLEKISRECVRKQEYKKVGIVFMNQPDYWAYDIVQDKSFLDAVYKKYAIKGKDIEDLIFKILDNISREFLDIYVINDPGLRINYYNKNDYVNGWIFHFLTKTEQISDEIEGYIKVQNDIRMMIYSELMKEMNKSNFAKKVKWLNSDEKNYPIIMTKGLKITSLPQGWIKMESKEDNGCISFDSELSKHSYGSAVCIPTLPEKLRENSLKQLEL